MKSAEVVPIERRKVVRIGADEVDFTDFPPLTMGDQKAMKKDYGLDLVQMTEFGAEDRYKLTLFLIRKLRPSTTEAEVDALPLKIAGELCGYAMSCSSRVDNPFSKRSTTSPEPTGGTSAPSDGSPSPS